MNTEIQLVQSRCSRHQSNMNTTLGSVSISVKPGCLSKSKVMHVKKFSLCSQDASDAKPTYSLTTNLGSVYISVKPRCLSKSKVMHVRKCIKQTSTRKSIHKHKQQQISNATLKHKQIQATTSNQTKQAQRKQAKHSSNTQ